MALADGATSRLASIAPLHGSMASVFLLWTHRPEVMSLVESAGMGHGTLLAALAILLSVMTEISAFRAAPCWAKPSGLARCGAAGVLRGAKLQKAPTPTFDFLGAAVKQYGPCC